MRESLAFTWVPDPKHLGIDPIFQYNNCSSSLHNLQLCCYDYEIYPELTLNGNIHFHGIITIKDKYKWHKKVLPTFKYSGYVNIKTNPDKGWIEYMSKDQDHMKRVLNMELPIRFFK